LAHAGLLAIVGDSTIEARFFMVILNVDFLFELKTLCRGQPLFRSHRQISLPADLHPFSDFFFASCVLRIFPTLVRNELPADHRGFSKDNRQPASKADFLGGAIRALQIFL